MSCYLLSNKLPHISLCSSNKNKIIKSKKFVIQYTGNHIFLQLLTLYTVQILITQMFVFEGEKPLHNRCVEVCPSFWQLCWYVIHISLLLRPQESCIFIFCCIDWLNVYLMPISGAGQLNLHDHIWWYWSAKSTWPYLVTVWWFSPGTPVSSTNKTDRHYITEILLKVVLNTII
jgi:hypothetical protein